MIISTRPAAIIRIAPIPYPTNTRVADPPAGAGEGRPLAAVLGSGSDASRSTSRSWAIATGSANGSGEQRIDDPVEDRRARHASS